MVPRVLEYEFSTSLNLIALRKINFHRSRQGPLQSLMLKGVRFRRSGNIHVRPNSLLALQRNT
jgi:hypothetical protein